MYRPMCELEFLLIVRLYICLRIPDIYYIFASRGLAHDLVLLLYPFLFYEILLICLQYQFILGLGVLLAMSMEHFFIVPYALYSHMFQPPWGGW